MQEQDEAYNASPVPRLACSGAPLQLMATNLAIVEAREVLRCDHCSLVQFRTANSLCRRCHKAIEVELPEALVPRLVPASDSTAVDEGLQVARTVREMRKTRNLSQRQLAGRMQVPRTYISKIENGKAMPTLSSLQRLATALEIDIRDLLQDSHSRRQIEVEAVLADPFLAEIALYVPKLDALQRSIFLNHVKDAATGRRRPA
jgi:transcriptional regulator with XRE-family HTH domain